MACLDEDTVVAFVEGQLAPAARQLAESHLAGCDSCADLVATAAGGNPSRLSVGGASPGGAALARGAAVGRYVILDAVGRGGMGEVYAAYDPQLDRKVALKLLHEQAGEGPSARARLLREAKTIARLSHPNVVVVHDAGEIDGRVFIAMEFIDGRTLGAWLAGGARGWREIRDVFLAAGEGLAAAHGAGVVHRDFKPQNVMVGRDGSVRVMDFGLASGSAAADGEAAGASDERAPILPIASDRPIDPPALTRTGVLIGTPLYMAPEQFAARGADARSDQFSYCVALYEALCGQRPFPSDSFGALAEAVMAGRVREPAQRARLPAFLRKLLWRGLKPEPSARFPDMRSLLEALRQDPARRNRRVAAVAAVAVLVMAGIATTRHVATRAQRMCLASGHKLGGIWEPPHQSGSPRREAIQNAFAATGASFAGDTWIRVEALLDDYTQRWSSMYTDACEATYVRGDQSSEALGLRMTCLEGARSGLRALSDVLARANRAVVTQAVNAVQALPPIDRCADAGRLPSAVPPPADAATGARVAGARVDLAEAKALIDTGQWAEARGKAVSVVTAARAIGYNPLLAEALEAQGQVEGSMGDSATCARLTEEAFWTALSSRADEVALECAALLSGTTGYTLGQYDEATRWDRLGQAILNRLGPGHERAAAWLAHDRGLIRLRKGEFDGALADLRWALALKQRILQPNDSDLARSWASIGSTLIEMGDVAGARDAYEKQLDVLQRAHGTNSPLLGHALGNRGEALSLLGRHAEAEKDLRESIVHWEQMIAPDHPWIAYPLTALGKSLIATGRAREALPILERAVRIRERGEPNLDMVAESRFALARARWEAGMDREGARTLARAARDGYRALPAQAKHTAEIDAWLAHHGGRPAR